MTPNYIAVGKFPATWRMPPKQRISQLRHELLVLQGQYVAAARENDDTAKDKLIAQGRLCQKELEQLETESKA